MYSLTINCSTLEEVANLLVQLKTTAGVVHSAPEPAPQPAAAPAVRPNVDPGESEISKIGSTTKAAIDQLLDFGRPIPEKYIEHAKLLWARGEIRFDGTDYYR